MEYRFKVENKESGQRRKYGDSYYHYIIEDLCDPKNTTDFITKKFCTTFLQPAVSEEQRRKDKLVGGSEGFNLHFKPYYTMFEKIENRKYEYKVVMPSTH